MKPERRAGVMRAIDRRHYRMRSDSGGNVQTLHTCCDYMSLSLHPLRKQPRTLFQQRRRAALQLFAKIRQQPALSGPEPRQQTSLVARAAFLSTLHDGDRREHARQSGYAQAQQPQRVP
jgi:hypothetical protein